MDSVEQERPRPNKYSKYAPSNIHTARRLPFVVNPRGVMPVRGLMTLRILLGFRLGLQRVAWRERCRGRGLTRAGDTAWIESAMSDMFYVPLLYRFDDEVRTNSSHLTACEVDVTCCGLQV
eukprot:4844241-Pyramimonas_sp.AAC.1